MSEDLGIVDPLSPLQAEIVALALYGDSDSSIPICPVPWPLTTTPTESLIYHIQRQSGELKEDSIPFLTKIGLISLEEPKDTEKKVHPTLFYRLASPEKAKQALEITKSHNSDLSEDQILAKAIQNLVSMIPPIYYEENYWWWTKSVLNHAIKLVDSVLDRVSGTEAIEDAIYLSDEFGYVLVFALWYQFYISNGKLYDQYLAACKKWVSFTPENHKAAMVVRCRTLLIEARTDSAETQRLERVLEYCNEARNIQEANKDIFHIKARTQAFITITSVHRYLGNFAAAEETIQHACAISGFPDFLNNPDHEVPRDTHVALCMAQILSSAATLNLAQDKEKVGEELCTRAFKIQASLLGRDHISTLATILKLTEARTCVLYHLAPSSFTNVCFSISRTNLDTLEELLTDSIAVSKKLYPETDLASCFLLQESDYLLLQTKWDEAVNSAEEGYQERLRVMGPTETDSLDALKQLAHVQRCARRGHDALRNHKLLESASIEKFGADAPRSIAATLEVAISLSNLNEIEEALVKCGQVLDIIQKNLSNIPFWLQKKAFGIAANLYRTAGDFEKSRQSNMARLELCEKHPDVWENVNALFDIAVTYEIEMNLAGAKQYYEKLGDVSHNYMLSDPSKASRMAQLFAEAYLGCTRILIQEGFSWNALTMLQQAWNTCQEYFPENKQFLGRWHESRAAIFESTGDFEQAIEHSELSFKNLTEDGGTDPTFIDALREQIDRYKAEAAAQAEERNPGPKAPASSSSKKQKASQARRRKQKNNSSNTILFASAIAVSVALVTVSAVLFYRALKK